MLVILKSNIVELLKLVKVYLVNFKNKAIINVTFDKLHKNDKMI